MTRTEAIAEAVAEQNAQNAVDGVTVAPVLRSTTEFLDGSFLVILGEYDWLATAYSVKEVDGVIFAQMTSR